MPIRFSTPAVHEVADVRAELHVFCLDKSCINAGRSYGSLSLIFVDEAGKEATMNAYFEAHFIDRARAIADAINFGVHAEPSRDAE